VITLEQAEEVLRNHTPEVHAEWCECCGNTYEWTCIACPDTWGLRSWLSEEGYTTHLIELLRGIDAAG
jgi:hypothetical protein